MIKAIIPGSAFYPMLFAAIVFILTGSSTATGQSGFVDPDILGQVHEVELLPDGKIIVAGTFSTVAGQARGRVARLNPNGSLDTSYQNPAVGPDSTSVFAAARQADGKLLIGGNFSTVGGQPRSFVARLNADGTLDPGFAADVSGFVTAIALQPDGKVVIGGGFVTVAGQSRQRVARLNSDGSLDASFGDPGVSGLAPGTSVGSLAIQADGKILIGGSFTSIASQQRSGGARLNANGTLDAGFALSIIGSVEQFRILPDGKVMICGFFSSVNGVPRRAIARLEANGGLDATFGDTAIPSGNIISFDIQSDGKIVVGGDFSVISGGERSDVARLNSDATFDPTFLDPNTNFGGSFSSISDLVLQPDNKVLVGGAFTTIGHLTRKNLVRLMPNGTVDLPPAQVVTVSKTADTNDGACNSDCSLREAVVAANATEQPTEVRFDPNVFGSAQTITLTLGEITFSQNRRVAIVGPGASLLTISGNNASRIFRLERDANVSIDSVKLSNGFYATGFGGGAIFVEPNGVITTLSIANSVISDNQAGSGAGIRTQGQSTVSISNTTISGNVANSNPGVGGLLFESGTLTITNTTITGNQSTGTNSGPGGISAGNATFTITDSTVSSNSGHFAGGIGAGANTTLNNVTITGNNSVVWAAGLYNGGITNVINSRILSNIASQSDSSGGGIYNQGRLTISGSIVGGNQAAFGAGIFTSGGLTIGATSITGNNANHTGGGIYNNIGGTTGLPVSITASDIYGNFAGNFAGGIQNRATMNLERSSIYENIANLGGGGVFNVFQAVEPAVMTFNRSTIRNNRSGAGGGGLQNQNGTVSFTNSTISSNWAQGAGGAMTVTSGGTANLSFTTVAFNTAASNGGVSVLSGSLNSNNSIIARNSAQNTRGDIAGTLNSQGYNLIGDTTGVTIAGDTTGNLLNIDPRLDPVARDNGGLVFTHALLIGSPAHDGARSTGGPTVDERGEPRPVDWLNVPNAPGGNGADIGSFERGSGEVARVLSPFDFDGDGRTDLSIFRPSNGQWWFTQSSTSQTNVFQFGSSSDRITPVDFTGDGKTDIAFWRPSTGDWFVLRSEDYSFYALPFGTSGDIPVPANFDGDAKADIAVFRPSNGTWYILKSSGGTRIEQFGQSGDLPVTADYDGDGRSDLAIFRPSDGTWWLNRSNAGVLAVAFGTGTDKPTPGDFTGDGKADVAFWRPSTGDWGVLRSEDLSFYGFPFGAAGDIPTPGDYDGDGRMDAAIFRPSQSTWYILRSTAGTLIQAFGSDGDRPIPSAFVP